MERVKGNAAKYWVYFFISLIAMILLLLTPYGQWFWLILPIVCTSFALAMDLL